MRWVLVTGAALGVGAEVCRTLAAKGWDIVIHYRYSREEAESVAALCRKEGVQAELVQGDFSSVSQTEAFISEYRTRFSDETHALVNNVGAYLVASALETTSEQWLSLFQSNFFAPVFLTQSLIPSLQAHRGSIVNLGISGLHKVRTDIAATAYCLTKLSLLGYTRSLARELASTGVRVNMVSPGQLANTVDLTEDLRLPMGRLGTLEEVARAIAFFIDPASSYITGQNLEVAGGYAL